MSLPVAGVLVDDQWYANAWELAVELRTQGEGAASDLVYGWLENARTEEAIHRWGVCCGDCPPLKRIGRR